MCDYFCCCSSFVVYLQMIGCVCAFDFKNINGFLRLVLRHLLPCCYFVCFVAETSCFLLRSRFVCYYFFPNVFYAVSMRLYLYWRHRIMLLCYFYCFVSVCVFDFLFWFVALCTVALTFFHSFWAKCTLLLILHNSTNMQWTLEKE